MDTQAITDVMIEYIINHGEIDNTGAKAREQFDALKDIAIQGQIMRDAQKLFFQLRKSVSKKEYLELLKKAQVEEKKFDNLIADMISPKQPSLL